MGGIWSLIGRIWSLIGRTWSEMARCHPSSHSVSPLLSMFLLECITLAAMYYFRMTESKKVLFRQTLCDGSCPVCPVMFVMVLVLVNGMHSHYFRMLTKGGFGFTEKNVHLHNDHFRRLTKGGFEFTHGKLKKMFLVHHRWSFPAHFCI